MTERTILINMRTVIAALKEVEKAKEDGHPLSPELSVKVVEMKQFAKRLEHAYKLRQLVLNLNSRTLAEIKSFKNPHPSIMKAMQATFLLLGSNVEDVDTWSEVRTKMGRTGREVVKTFDISIYSKPSFKTALGSSQKEDS